MCTLPDFPCFPVSLQAVHHSQQEESLDVSVEHMDEEIARRWGHVYTICYKTQGWYHVWLPTLSTTTWQQFEDSTFMVQIGLEFQEFQGLLRGDRQKWVILYTQVIQPCSQCNSTQTLYNTHHLLHFSCHSCDISIPIASHCEQVEHSYDHHHGFQSLQLDVK